MSPSRSMENKADNKFTWVINNFSTLNSAEIYSDQFIIGGCQWSLKASTKGDYMADMFCLYLVVADAKYLPSGWRRHAKFSFTIVNQIVEKAYQLIETEQWFNHENPDWGFRSLVFLSELTAKTGEFIVNGEVKIVVEVEVLEVIGKLDVLEKSEASHPADWVDVNGFQVLSSQVKFVSRIFKKYPNIALEFRAKNPHLRTACMNVLISLIETLCQSPQELANEDLVEADNALGYVKDAGFKVDWLEKKLKEVKEKKEAEQTGETRVQELEEELKDFKQKCSDIEALLAKEKAKVLAARTHQTLDEFV